MKPPRPLCGVDGSSPLRVLESPPQSAAPARLGPSGAAGRALWHRGEAFSCPATSLHPPALNYKPTLSTWAIKKASARSSSPVAASPSREAAGCGGQHSDLLQHPQQGWVCSWGFHFCSLEWLRAVTSHGQPRDAPGAGLGCTAHPWAKLPRVMSSQQ